jgi:Skp family chaperone for outer membrane proteins
MSFLIRKILVFLTIIPLTAVSSWSQELKFGFVEDQQILTKLPEVKEIQRILDKETDLWEKRFQERQKLLKVYYDSVATVSTALEKSRQEISKAPAEGKPLSAGTIPQDSAKNTPADSVKNKAMTAASKSVKKEDAVKEATDTLDLHKQIARLENELERSKKEVVALYHQIYGKDGLLNRRNAELSQSVLEKINRVIAETGEKQNVSMIFDSSILFYIDKNLNLTDEVMQALGIEKEGAR